MDGDSRRGYQISAISYQEAVGRLREQAANRGSSPHQAPQKRRQFQIQFVRRWPMNRSSLLGLGLLLSSTACFGQTTPADSQTLQALLSEVRLLRQDLQITTIAAQRAQILLYRLQGQEAAVARASQRLEEAKEKLAGIQAQRNYLATDVKRHEDFISNTENPPTQRKEFEERLPRIKSELESTENLLQQQQTRETDAEQYLRAEEVKLSDLQDQLDRLDKALENASHRTGSSHQ